MVGSVLTPRQAKHTLSISTGLQHVLFQAANYLEQKAPTLL